MAKNYDSIEEWANDHKMTLEDALEMGISQTDNGEIVIPRSAWKIILIHLENVTNER